MAGIPTNPLRQKMHAGEPVFGISVRLARSPDIARIAKATGHDFLFIDAQHSIFNPETIGAMAQTALAIGIAPLVRVRGIGDPDVSLLLDNGVTGIVYPDVANAAQAQHAVDICQFAPLGRRSVCGSYPHFDHAPTPLARSIPALADHAVVVCMIETQEGLANVEEIAATPGVDVILLGTNDLLVNLGKGGQFDSPEAVAAQRLVIEAARRHGKVAGCGGNRDVARQAAAVKAGARFLTTQTDIGFLAAAAGAWTRGLREALGQ